MGTDDPLRASSATMAVLRRELEQKEAQAAELRITVMKSRSHRQGFSPLSKLRRCRWTLSSAMLVELSTRGIFMIWSLCSLLSRRRCVLAKQRIHRKTRHHHGLVVGEPLPVRMLLRFCPAPPLC